ncbi:MAG: right-handed parallel beta-helix repeat-containing protein [Candidatus Aenigmarchaeota archaeon]|nr:right-handed parallel beta-helix repeat-containing protein [Candidatus Aenigmarchaeota archaeon]
MKTIHAAIIFIPILILLTMHASAQACLTGADDPANGGNCDYVIDMEELMSYIGSWYGCSSCVPGIFEAIQAFYGIQFCGDGSCDSGAGEDCSTCAADCVCPAGVPIEVNRVYVDHLLAADCHGTYSIADRDCGGSDGDAFDTIQEGVNSANPGYTVLIMGSTDPDSPDAVYNVTTNGISTVRPGLPDQRIVIRSYPGHTVVIQGDGGDMGINLDKASYHTFKGLAFRNFNKATETSAAIAKNGIVIEDCEFSQTYETGLRLRNVHSFAMRNSYVHNCFETGIWIRDGSDDVIFENVESSYNFDSPNPDNSDADGFALSGYNITCINCTAIGNGEDGFDITANALIVNAIGAGSAACNMKFWRRSSDGYAPKNSTVINSIFRDAGETGIKVSAGAEVHIYNSVFYNNGEEGIAFRGFSTTSDTVMSEIKNNIISGCGYEGIGVGQDSGAGAGFNHVTASSNLYFSNAMANNGLSADFDSIVGDPLFFSPGTGDFHLKHGSPAIDMGAPLAGTADRDFDGTSRPQDGDLDGSAEWDIGAYEHHSVAGNTGPSFIYNGPASFSVNENGLMQAQFGAQDPEGDDLRYLLLGGDVLAEMSIDNSGLFSFTPSFERSNSSIDRTFHVTVGVTDEHYYYPPDSLDISITVHDVDRPPEYGGLSLYTLVEGRRFRIRLPISDPDGDASIANALAALPANAAYDDQTHIIDWTPGSSDRGMHAAVLDLDDGAEAVSYEVSFLVMDSVPYAEPANEPDIFYVDGNSGSDSYDGQTPGTAWRTIQKAKSTLAAGQMALIRGGVYNEYGSIANSGAYGSPIIFKAYPGERVIMDGTGFGSPEAFNFPGGVSDIVIDGITMFNYGETIYLRGGNHNITLVNLNISDARDFGIYGNLFNDRIENVVIDGIGDRGIHGGGSNIHIYNTNISNFVERGISISSSSADNINIIRSNLRDSGGSGTYGILASGKNTMISETTVINATYSAATVNSDYAYIQNSIFAGTRLRSGSANNIVIGSGTEFELYNSVLYGSSRYGLYLSAGMSGIQIMRNCIVYGSPTEVRMPSGFSFNEDHNIFGAGFSPIGANSFNAFPQFVDASAYDFHLLPSSPAIDKGTDVGIAEDYDGIPVPQGSAPDIGPFEHIP